MSHEITLAYCLRKTVMLSFDYSLMSTLTAIQNGVMTSFILA